MRTICMLAIASNFLFILADEVTLTRSVRADPVYLKVICTFDPKSHELFFISTLQSRFDDYCQLHIANFIYGFDFAAMFMDEIKQYDFNFHEGETIVTSWCELQTTFSVLNDADSLVFSSNNATQVVSDFCSTSELGQLMDQLKHMENITLRSIDFYPAWSEEVKELLKDSSTRITDSASESNDKESKSLMVLAYTSLAIILIALTALVLSSLRKRIFLGKIKYDNTSDVPSPLSCSADNLLVVRAINRDIEHEVLASNTSNNSKVENVIFSSDCEKSGNALQSERDAPAFGDDPSGHMESWASETFDDEKSASSRTEGYSQYQCNSSLASNSVSPSWSIDSYSQNTSPCSAQAEGLSKRRR